MPCRPSSVRLISSQRSRTRPAVRASAFGQQQREEVDLEQEVTELVGELRVVAPDRRVGDLVGLLDRMRDDRALGLLTIPGAVAP